jgi:Carboxypeptidase regulatory-like domain
MTITAFLLIFFGLIAGAQPAPKKASDISAELAGRISGNIMDDKGQSLEAVTVALLNAGDSTRIRETVTNKAGHFVFSDVQTGKYLLLATSVGFNKQYSPLVERQQ